MVGIIRLINVFWFFITKRSCKQSHEMRYRKRNYGDTMTIEEEIERCFPKHNSQLVCCNQEDRCIVTNGHTTYEQCDHDKKPVIVKLDVSGIEMYFEVNPSYAISSMPEDIYHEYFSNHKLQKHRKGILMFSDERITVLGEVDVSVSYNTVTYPGMNLYVTRGSRVNIVGLDWSLAFKDESTLQTEESVAIFNNSQHIPKQISNNISEKLKEFVAGFGTVFTDELKPIRKLRYKININQCAEPKFCKSTTLPPGMKELVKDEINRMEERGILKSVRSSKWASPLLIIPQANGKIKLYGDYKCTINTIIEKETVDVLTATGLSLKLKDGKRYSKIDLTQACSQIHVHKDSRKYLTVNTCVGLKEVTRIPDGIKCTTGRVLQKLITKSLDTTERIVVKVDGIIITGVDDEDHLKNLVKVCEVLEQLDVTVNIRKCSFFAPQVEYLGFIVDKNGIRVDPKNVMAVANLVEPTNMTQLQIFISGFLYYADLIGNISSFVAPLHKLIDKGFSWKWTTQEKVAFEASKLCLSRYPVLYSYDPHLPLILACSASKYGIGAVLSHTFPDQTEKPIAFASRPLNKDEENLCQRYRSGASIIFGLKEFNQFCQEQKFTILTDNFSIREMFDSRTALPPDAHDYLKQWSLTLNQYEYSIRFKQKKDHCNANMLSRLPVSKTSHQFQASYNWQVGSLPIPMEVIRSETKNDDVLKQVITYLRGDQWPNIVSEVLRPYYDIFNDLFLKYGVVVWGSRVVMPFSLQATTLKELHVQHPGVVCMKALSLVHVWYPGIEKHIERVAKDCETCTGITIATRRPLIQPWTTPAKAMDKVHVEYFEYKQNMYLMMVDSFSKMMDVKVMYDTDCEYTITCLITWFSKYGLPKQLLSNNQFQFESSVFAMFMQMNGIQHIRRLSCEQSGEIGCYVQTVKRGLFNVSTNRKGNAQDDVNKFLATYLNSLLKQKAMYA